MKTTIDKYDQERRWRMTIGVEDDDSFRLTERDTRISTALSMLYDADKAENKKGRGDLGKSAPRITRWMGDVREFFPASVVQIIQKDAFSRLGLRQMLLEPEFLSALEADVNLVADLISLRSAIPDKAKETARSIICKVVDELIKRLEQKTADAIRGAVNKSKRTNRPRHVDIDWHRTIVANLRNYQPKYQTVIPERLIGYHRSHRRLVDMDEIMLCVDQSGSMASSVIYASIFAAVMASLPVVKTKLVCFDTAILDLTDELEDPVNVLFGVQLGGGTDINQAIAYCSKKIERPSKSHFILISDLYEGGNKEEMTSRIAALIRSGVNVIVLLALTDKGNPSYDTNLAGIIASMGAPVFACTPDRFPDLMACALRKESIHQWAAKEDIKLIRPDDGNTQPRA